MSTFVQKVTSAVAGLAIAFSVVAPTAGVSAAYTSVEAANKLSTLGVIVDQSANPADYRLGDNLPRKEATKVMMNLSSVSVVDNCTGSFADLTSADWACKYAETALANGMVAGNANFRPDDLVSKIEALKMVFQGRDLERNADADWKMGYVSAAVELGVASAAFTDYDTPATRGQMFIWAVNAIDAGEVADPTDLICEILGTCDTPVVVEPTEPTTPAEPVTPPVTTSGTATVSLSPLSPSNGLAAVNTPRVSFLTFDVTAGASDVTLQQAELFHVGLGNRINVQDVTIYDSRNASVSRDRDFRENDLDITFDRGIIVQAGTTETFTIAATIDDDGSTNTTYQIELASLETSAGVVGAGIVGAALTPTIVSNSALLEVQGEDADEDIDVGDEVSLARFTLEETRDNEDVLIRTITLHQNGSVDDDMFEDLTLEVDGAVVASDLVIFDDELVINLDYVLAADDEVEFDLMGVVSGDVGETVFFQFEENDDIYATGLSTGFNIGFESGKGPVDEANDISTSRVVEGAEINAVFDESDIDETKVDIDDVLIGTLELTADSGEYEIEEIEVTVTGSAGTAAVDELYLDDIAADSISGNVYTFTDIFLTPGVTEILPLTFDIPDNVGLNGNDVEFSVRIVRINDDEDNVTYTDGWNPDVDEVLSSNSFDEVNIDIETANFDLTQTRLTPRDVVVSNGVEVVLYKGSLNIGDADSVNFESMTFRVGTSNTWYDLEDVLDSAELIIGGETETWDVEPDRIDFDNLNVEVAAGSNNIDVLLVGTLESNDEVVNGDIISVTLVAADIDAEDSDNEDLLAAAKRINNSAATVVNLNESGTFAIAVINDGDRENLVEDVVLTGTDDVVLSEITLEADEEAVDVEELVLTLSGTAAAESSTFSNVRIMDGSTVIATANEINQVGSNTEVTFEDFIVAESDDEIDAVVVADIAPVSNQGGVAAVQAGIVTVTVTSVEAEGAESNDDITADISDNVVSEGVNLVPALVTVAVEAELDEDDEDSQISFIVDEGNNDLDDDDVLITSILFTNSSEVVNIDTIENDEGDDLIFTVSGQTVVFNPAAGTESDYKLNTGDIFKITVNLVDGTSLDIEDNGIMFTVDGATYESSNERELDLGTYTND